jgi:hypothetical protein
LLPVFTNFIEYIQCSAYAGIPHCKDRIGVVKRDAPGFGQVQLPPSPVKQMVAQTFLKLTDLHGNCGLRQVHPLGGAGQVAIMRNGPKKLQVVIVAVSRTFCLSERFSINSVFCSLLHHSYIGG